MSTEIFDDKSPVVIPFILSHLQHHPKDTPFFIGLNGVQGAGKTVLTSTLHQTLTSPPHNLNTVVFSLDDLYLTHDDQLTLAKSNPSNPLLQHRGQPGTHDIPLLLQIFQSLQSSQPTQIPNYNKSLFSGQGDRSSPSDWTTVNTNPCNPIRVILFEGWCVGFQPLSPSALFSKHNTAVRAFSSNPSTYAGRLAHNTLSSITTINTSLQSYLPLWHHFNVFIHIDALSPLYVYKWRLEQEATTKRQKGSGMTDDQVKSFVDGYYPSYELYTDTLRRGIFAPAPAATSQEGGEQDEDSLGNTDNSNEWKGNGRQLRLIVGEDRKVQQALEI